LLVGVYSQRQHGGSRVDGSMRILDDGLGMG